jgi:hypothetical protein
MAGPEVYYFPACDLRNKRVISVDLGYSVDVNVEFLRLDKETSGLSNKNILPYHDKRLYKNGFSNPPGEIIQHEPDYLQSKSNYCPKCEKFTLEFIQVGLFD